MQELGTELGSSRRTAHTVIHLSSALLLYFYCVDKTVSMCGYMNVCAGAPVQRVSDHLELKFQATYEPPLWCWEPNFSFLEE